MSQDFSLIQVMMKGGWAIGLLVLLSILVFAVLYERWSYFRSHFQSRELVMAGLEPFLGRKSAQECIEACDRNGTLLAQIVRAGLKAKSDKTDVQQAMEREAKIQLLKLERHLPLLATIGSIAPFVGLFGTVLGIIRAFRDLALANAGGAAVVSQGIAEALIATATGLFVAITAVFIYNTFQARLNVMAQEAEIVISEMNERIEK
jgi:biopolymer transport protein ExbB